MKGTLSSHALVFGSDAAKQQAKLDRLTRLLEAEASANDIPFDSINIYKSRVSMSMEERRWAIDQLVTLGLWVRFADDEGEYAAPVVWLFKDENA